MVYYKYLIYTADIKLRRKKNIKRTGKEESNNKLVDLFKPKGNWFSYTHLKQRNHKGRKALLNINEKMHYKEDSTLPNIFTSNIFSKL